MGWASNHIKQLQAGKTITFRPTGQSMKPRINSGDACTVAPIGEKEIEKGEIVLCKVNGREFLHLVSATKSGKDGVYSVQISNNHNHVNGWCSVAAVYGRLIQAD